MFFLKQIKGISLLNGKCILDSQCLPTQYCKTSLLNPLIGECVEGKQEQEWCIGDSSCASKVCRYFKCKKRITFRDGACSSSIDCPDDQYCKKNDRKICTNKKCTGACTRDSQCLSSKCHLMFCLREKAC